MRLDRAGSNGLHVGPSQIAPQIMKKLQKNVSTPGVRVLHTFYPQSHPKVIQMATPNRARGSQSPPKGPQEAPKRPSGASQEAP